jgi:CheY-like chemotaxis protein
MRDPVATLLLVDDNQGFRDVFTAIVEDSDPAFAVRAVETATEAIRFLQSWPPHDFIVLDFHLPDLDAPRLLSELARHARLHAVPVLVLSQADWPEDRAAALREGATAFAVKPSRVEALHETIASFWRAHLCRPA